MNDPYPQPQLCPLCRAGPFEWPRSMRRHSEVHHAHLSPRARAELMELAEKAAQGRGPPVGVELNLSYSRPPFCPRCERGPFVWPPSLWLHAYGYHGYLSHRDLAEIMEAALLRSQSER